MPPKYTREELFGREGAGHYGSGIGFPVSGTPKTPINPNLGLRIATEGLGFLYPDKPKTSPDISNIPEVLKNLRKSIQGPCCDILTTPEQK